MEFEGGSVKPILTSEQHDSYKRDGFLVLENFFDPSELEILYADFNDVVGNWANIYYKGDYTISHNHQDFTMGFSFAYFLKSEWYHPPFVFTNSGKKIKSKEGTYVIFPNHVNHHVPKNRFKETRITLSGNILTTFEEGMIKQP